MPPRVRLDLPPILAERSASATSPKEGGDGDVSSEEDVVVAAVSRRSDRRPITMPPERFIQKLRAEGQLSEEGEDDEDQEEPPEDSQQAVQADAAMVERHTGSMAQTRSETAMPARVGSNRSITRRRHGSVNGPLSPDKRSLFQEQRIRRLRFDLDPRAGHRRPLESKQSGRQSAAAAQTGGQLLSWILAGSFGMATSASIFSGLLWHFRGRVSRLRDNFRLDGDWDGVLNVREILFGFALYAAVMLLGVAIAQGALSVYYYTWFGVRAIRQSRRAAELQKSSPFFVTKLNSTVDHSMLEYFQSNYDSGPVINKMTGQHLSSSMPPSAGDAEDPSRSRSMSNTSQTSRRPSLRRDVSETHRSASEYLSMSEALSNLPPTSSASDTDDDDEKDEPGGEITSIGAAISSETRDTGRDATRYRKSFAAGGEALGAAPRKSAVGGLFVQELGCDTGRKLQELICRLAEWNFDIFEVAELTQRPLAYVGYVCLDAYSKLVDFDKHKVIEFLREVEGSYRKVPYHNGLHGAAVARSVYSFCAGCGLAFTQEYMEFTIVLAGLVHDVHHPGLTATFLSKASTNGQWVSSITPPLEPADMELSLKYNDQSPLENMHCAITFDLLKKERTAFLSKDDVVAMRKPLVRAILGTDMAKHAETMTRLAALIDNLEHDENETVAIPWHWPAKPPATADEEHRAVWERFYQEEFVMELFLHAADIGTPSLPFDQWCKWNRLVQKEFLLQGDRELLEFGELISPPAGFDRNASVKAEHGFTKGFMQYLSLPLFQKLHELTQVQNPISVCQGVNISGCLVNLKRNIHLWDNYTPERDVEVEAATKEAE